MDPGNAPKLRIIEMLWAFAKKGKVKPKTNEQTNAQWHTSHKLPTKHIATMVSPAAKKQQQQQQRPRRRKPARSVQFAPDDQLCSYQNGPKELTEETERDVWFQSQEYEEIRENAKVSSKDGVDNGLDFYLSHTYGYTDEESQNMLNRWTYERDTLRGLERFVNSEYNAARLKIRNNTIKCVIYTQKRLETRDKETNYDRRAEALYEVSIIASREASEFAFMMGSADQKAAVMLRTLRNTPSSSSSSSHHSSTKANRRTSIQSTASQSSFCSSENGTESFSSTVPVEEISSHKRSMLRQPAQINPRKISLLFGRKRL